MYEGLLEKNANEKKSGAGQYFTPRVLIDVMTEIIKPQLGDKCFDPACGTFGFMIAANRYVNAHNDMYALSDRQADFHRIKRSTAWNWYTSPSFGIDERLSAQYECQYHIWGFSRTKRQGIERF